MPELPEVETIARGLSSAITGKTIDSAAVFRPVVYPESERFAREIAGERIAAVGRRGKFVVFSLGSGRRLVVHLRMTGRLIVQRAEATSPPEPYSNVVLRFKDRSRLCFADVRRFGRMRLVEPEEEWASDIGLEPLSSDFSFESFSNLLSGRTTPIKVLLLDQRRIAGLGNIYACEALWDARIRPSRPAGTLSKAARQRLHTSIQTVLRRAIEMRGTSIDDYVDADGLRGGFQNVLSVYGREGRTCTRCESLIKRTVLGQRGTWWCRTCQPR